MKNDSKKVRGLGLCSGGLDSILSALVLREQGIEVEWITFETPFFAADRAMRASRNTGIRLTVENITPVYLPMLKNPPCGYGQHMNPCLDCHALMFKLAGQRMTERGFDFLFSGEVVGQRPMSQTKPSLRYVEKHSGYEGYILRPLCAKNLPPTQPEKQGLVDRDLLGNLSGRSRKPQIQMARKFGIKDYPTPAGGCLLTDRGFSARLRDLFDHRDSPGELDLHLLRYGRHMRLTPETKIIVGRTRKDNEQIMKYYRPESDTLVKIKKYPGPIVLVPGGGEQRILALAAAICAGYSQAPNDAPVEATAVTSRSRESITILGLPTSDSKRFLI